MTIKEWASYAVGAVGAIVGLRKAHGEALDDRIRLIAHTDETVATLARMEKKLDQLDGKIDGVAIDVARLQAREEVRSQDASMFQFPRLPIAKEQQD